MGFIVFNGGNFYYEAQLIMFFFIKKIGENLIKYREKNNNIWGLG